MGPLRCLSNARPSAMICFISFCASVRVREARRQLITRGRTITMWSREPELQDGAHDRDRDGCRETHVHAGHRRMAARTVDVDRAPDLLERRVAQLRGERGDVGCVRPARRASDEMQVEHSPLELRELAVELERHLRSDALAHNGDDGLRSRSFRRRAAAGVSRSRQQDSRPHRGGVRSRQSGTRQDGCLRRVG